MPGRSIQTSDAKRWSSARRRLLVALLVAVSTTLSLSPSGVAFADRGRQHHGRSADVTFTKWITTAPADPATAAGVFMAGVVGGDVGRGRYAGLIISDDTTSQPGFWLGHARYELYGSRHTVIADVHITEDDRTPALITATIQGVVTRGWLKGAQVTGQYRQWDACPISTPGNVNGTVCFEGTLHLQPGDRDRH